MTSPLALLTLKAYIRLLGMSRKTLVVLIGKVNFTFKAAKYTFYRACFGAGA